MPSFPAEFSKQAEKYIKKLDTITKKRIQEKIDKLEENPVEELQEQQEGT